MNRSITLFIAFGCGAVLSTQATAQDTLRAWNLFHANDIIMYGNSEQILSPNVVPGSGGLGQTWIFTTTAFEYLDTMNIVAMQNVPVQYSAMFPQANLAIYHGSNQTTYDFVHSDGGSSMNLLGSASLDPNFGVQREAYVNPLEYLHWPMYYGTTFMDTATINRRYPTTGPSDSAWEVHMIEMEAQVDAQGTVITSYGSYGVIRVRRDITFWSQYATHDPNTGWTSFSSVNSSARVYEWWTDSIHIGWMIAQVQVNPANGGVLGYRILTDYTVDIYDHAPVNPVSLYPNPANDFIFASGEINSRWEIRDMDARLVKSGVMRNNTEEIDIAGLAAGVYVLQMTNEKGEQASRKFVHCVQ